MEYIIRRLLESHQVDESFEYKGYKYYKYAGACKRKKINSDGSYEDEEPVSDEEYAEVRDLNNKNKSTGYEDLDDETILDIKRLTKLRRCVSEDDTLNSVDRQRYLTIIDKYFDVSVTHNIPVSNYSHKTLRDKRHLSELNQLLINYLDYKNPPDSQPQEYEPIRRKYN